MSSGAVRERTNAVHVAVGRDAAAPAGVVPLPSLHRSARIAAAIVLLLTFAILTAACNGVDDLVDLGPAVTGTVTDAANNQALAAVVVTVGGRQGITNPNGTFFIAEVNRGTQVITATKEGYVRYSGEVTIGNGELTDVKIAMVRE